MITANLQHLWWSVFKFGVLVANSVNKDVIQHSDNGVNKSIDKLAVDDDVKKYDGYIDM